MLALRVVEIFEKKKKKEKKQEGTIIIIIIVVIFLSKKSLFPAGSEYEQPHIPDTYQLSQRDRPL